MTTATQPQAEQEQAGAAASAPDWDCVPFDVHCARCGADLRGLTDPGCPACALTFDWSEAVPVEKLTCGRCGYHLYGLTTARCPECGTEFDWNDRLADYHRTRLPYFEYRWRDRPVRSFVTTWWRALRPKRFWSTMNLHDPPDVAGLTLMVIILIVAVGVTIAAGRSFAAIYAAVADLLFPAPWMINRGFTAKQRLIWMLYDIRYNCIDPELPFCLALTATWLAMSLLALLIFQQSMRRCRVRTAQVVRVWAYSTPMALPVLMFVAGLSAKLPWSLFGLNLLPMKPNGGMDFVVAGAASWLLAIRAEQLGYARYLRMPHAFGVAASAQVMALLGAFAVVDYVSGYGASTLVVQVLGRWVRAW